MRIGLISLPGAVSPKKASSTSLPGQYSLGVNDGCHRKEGTAFTAFLHRLCSRRPVKDKNAGMSRSLQEFSLWHNPLDQLLLQRGKQLNHCERARFMLRDISEPPRHLSTNELRPR
jgi:hypothetical protein